MVSKSVIVLLALVAVAAAVEVRDKRQIILPGLAPLPLAAATRAIIPPIRTIPDDGSWAPGKYDPVEVPLITPLAAASPIIAAPGLSPLAPLAPAVRLGLNPWGPLVL